MTKETDLIGMKKASEAVAYFKENAKLCRARNDNKTIRQLWSINIIRFWDKISSVINLSLSRLDLHKRE